MNEHAIVWVAPEYEHREHSADWFWAVGIISVSLAVAFVIVGNMLLSIIILVGMGMLLFYSKHPPRLVEYSLTKQGVKAGATLYPWETISSFWILEAVSNAKFHRDPKIIFTSKKAFMPHIVVPLNHAVIEDVHQTLLAILPEEHQMEPLPERLMRKIGF